ARARPECSNEGCVRPWSRTGAILRPPPAGPCRGPLCNLRRRHPLTFAARMSLRAVACRLGPVFVIVLAVVAAALLATLLPGARKAALADACPASGPPCPANAFISLSVTAGGPNTDILVSGGQFLAGQSMSLYWDSSNKVVGSTTADSPRQQRTMPTAAITHRSTRPTWGAAPPEIASEREGPRPAWPTSPPLPAQPHRSDPLHSAREEFPEGTDERPHWPAPRPPIPDDPEESEQPPPEIDG